MEGFYMFLTILIFGIVIFNMVIIGFIVNLVVESYIQTHPKYDIRVLRMTWIVPALFFYVSMLAFSSDTLRGALVIIPAVAEFIFWYTKMRK